MFASSWSWPYSHFQSFLQACAPVLPFSIPIPGFLQPNEQSYSDFESVIYVCTYSVLLLLAGGWGTRDTSEVLRNSDKDETLYGTITR